MSRRVPILPLAIALSLLAGKMPATEAAAQLRPYDPLEWDIFEVDHGYLVAGGGSVLAGQKASLAGSEGTLLEIGSFQALARSGRIALDIGGTVYRVLEEERVYDTPLSTTRAQEPGRRSDWGDYRIATAVLLTRPAEPGAIAVRFGTRLPTTDNRIGLERDRTDFFALLAARLDRGSLRATAEAGIGIHGTREPEFEQSDVFVYSAGAALRTGVVRPGLFLVGHADGLPNKPIRGNERLAELRFQLRAGEQTWVRLEVVRGLASYSPGAGLAIALGTVR